MSSKLADKSAQKLAVLMSKANFERGLLLGFNNLALAIFADVGVTLIVILYSLQIMKWKDAPLL